MEIICCSCNRVKNGKSWKKQVLDNGKERTHGYCPKCFAQMMKKIDTRFQGREVAAA